MTDSRTAPPPPALADVAVHVAPSDNVAVVKYGAPAGATIRLPALPAVPGAGAAVTLLEAVPGGHRFALCDVPDNTCASTGSRSAPVSASAPGNASRTR
jgi:hypothetical protein